MDTMQMVVAIPLCFGSFVHYLWLVLLCKIHINTDEYWVDVIISPYGERPAWAAPITLTCVGSAYYFNLLMYFLVLRIGTRHLPVIFFWVYPLYSQK